MLRYLKGIIMLPVFGFLVFATSSCGIENIPQLNPPTVYYFPSSGDYNFYFSATEDNDENYFKGFNLYYKFYSHGDRSVTNDIDLQDVIGNDIITKYGFHRIYSSNDSSNEIYNRPLIPIKLENRGSNYDITVHFDTLKEPYIESSILSSYIVIRRDVPDPPYGLKMFNDFADVDSDLPDNIRYNISSIHEIDLILYAASYGFDESTGIVIYSTCKYLGIITLDLNNFIG